MDSSEAHITTLTCVDEQTGIPHCVSVPTKSPSDGYMVASVCKWLERICRTKIILRSDGEPAIIKLTGMIKNKRLKEGFETMVQTGPRYSSQSLGAIGAAQRLFIGQMRTMRADLELRFGRQILPDHPIFAWMVRHACWLLERFHLRAGGTTQFSEAFGHSYR